MEAVQQMNVRISSDLKKRGDEEIAAMGLTPSQVVRKVYEALTGTASQRQNIEAVLHPAEELSEHQKEAQRKIARAESVMERLAEFKEAHGIPPAPEFCSNAEMGEYVAEAIMEKWSERGIA